MEDLTDLDPQVLSMVIEVRDVFPYRDNFSGGGVSQNGGCQVWDVRVPQM